MVMEEAYAQLYEEFLCLRSLCLKQATLLRQLTDALQKKQGSSNGDLTQIMSMMDRIDSEYPVYLSASPEPPQPPPALTPSDAQGPSANIGSFSNLLAQDMSKLSVESAAQGKKVKSELSVPQSLISGFTQFHEASYNQNTHLHLDQNQEVLSGAAFRTDESSHTPFPGLQKARVRRGANVLPQPNGPVTTLIMSDVTLYTDVCEFCHAVFPSDTTTRGEYLRHLYTHVT